MDTNKASTLFLMHNIRILLASKRATQAMLGDAIGIGQAQISKWIGGRAVPDTLQLIAISKYFNTTLDELVFHDLSKRNPHDLEARERVLSIMGIIGADEAYRRLLVATPSQLSTDQVPSVSIIKTKHGSPIRKKRGNRD